MHRWVDELEVIDTVRGSSNFGVFMRLLENEDSEWIGKINAKLEE